MEVLEHRCSLLLIGFASYAVAEAVDLQVHPIVSRILGRVPPFCGLIGSPRFFHIPVKLVEHHIGQQR